MLIISKGGTMKATILFNILKLIYPRYIRPVLSKAIDDPDSEWDEILMGIVDRIFLYILEEENGTLGS